MTNESTLLSACLRLLKRELKGSVVLKHADPFTSGIPDVSVTWNGKTSFWEFKYGPRIKWSNGLQQLTCHRLATAGTCWVVYYSVHRTHVVSPTDEVTQASVDGHDHRFVVEFIKQAHQ